MTLPTRLARLALTHSRLQPILAGVVSLVFASGAMGMTSDDDCSLPPPASALEPSPADASAEALMATLERNFRSRPKVVRMDIHTTYARPRMTPRGPLDLDNRKTLWGVFDGDLQQTRLLYVFTGPG